MSGLVAASSRPNAGQRLRVQDMSGGDSGVGAAAASVLARDVGRGQGVRGSQLAVIQQMFGWQWRLPSSEGSAAAQSAGARSCSRHLAEAAALEAKAGSQQQVAFPFSNKAFTSAPGRSGGAGSRRRGRPPPAAWPRRRRRRRKTPAGLCTVVWRLRRACWMRPGQQRRRAGRRHLQGRLQGRAAGAGHPPGKNCASSTAITWKSAYDSPACCRNAASVGAAKQGCGGRGGAGARRGAASGTAAQQAASWPRAQRCAVCATAGAAAPAAPARCTPAPRTRFRPLWVTTLAEQ